MAYRLGDPTAKITRRLSLNPIRHLDPLGTLMFFITLSVLAGSCSAGRSPSRSPRTTSRTGSGAWPSWVAWPGPLTNFVLAVVFAVVLSFVGPAALRQPGRSVRAGSSPSSSCLAGQRRAGIFNLIPIPPLDGSRVVGGVSSPEGVREVGGHRPLRHVHHLHRCSFDQLFRGLGGIAARPAPSRRSCWHLIFMRDSRYRGSVD